MDYNNEFEENSFPKRTDERYKRIEKFQPYELTHCIIFEMAGRNEEIKKLIHDIAAIELVQKQVRKLIAPSIDDLFKDQKEEKKDEIPKSTLEKYQEYELIYKDMIRLLKEQYYIHFDQNAIHIPAIENPFKKDISNLSIEEAIDEIKDALKAPFSKHIGHSIGSFLHENYNLYKSDHNIYEGFVTARGIDVKCDTFDISNINTHFKRKIYDTNQINVALNMSLPEEELVQYIRHIKRTLPKSGDKSLKSPNYLLGKSVEEAKKTKHYPKIPTAKKLADMFFVYDYVKAKLKEHEYCEDLMKKEYEENKDSVKKSFKYTTAEKEEQLQTLKIEYEGNRTSIKVEDVFKDFDNSNEIKGKASTASNYYYALKPYIEEYRYPEFLTGESIIEEDENKKEEE